ncbi:hypothetical protein J3Q64DRAFT_1824475 [Phycomyces blakesleeanus]|uniref:LIM zinc-binding domain-containing protein n=2 Tax=Phycomyces blakesleeanus TaxID=4837 RepID=A0A162QA64_PHYB8|nr:hypothetical protein PHYBLDRAFT_138902 [Phycomyces blakesleeanus NRRL 1555(-)]OAD81356.1 hypothetical protein PHYBLDRAFT_138902 [Phycomyces blakesleeanus NRRL 1555(-)]|eukprot:XP_018299396.1 hypothetical protein PHYBLDRAFT_138902 [Phycomyces blakesleeanus NRRL 1555(-)]
MTYFTKRLDNGLGTSSRLSKTEKPRPTEPQPHLQPQPQPHPQPKPQHQPKPQPIKKSLKQNKSTLSPAKPSPRLPSSNHAKTQPPSSPSNQRHTAPNKLNTKNQNLPQENPNQKQHKTSGTKLPLCTLPPTHAPLGLHSPRPFYEAKMRTPPVQLQHALTLCHTCQLPILCGILIRTSLESTSPSWHAKCFKCGTCGRRLTSTAFFNKDNELYCAADYQALFGVQCYGCLKPITEAYQSAMGKQYHMGHFLCYQCHTPFKNEDSFKVHKGQAYCEHDYNFLDQKDVPL